METHGVPNHSQRQELIMEGRTVRSLKGFILRRRERGKGSQGRIV